MSDTLKRWSVSVLYDSGHAGLLLILLPLLVLARQAWQSALNALSDQAAVTNRSTLIDARRSEAIDQRRAGDGRSYRRYCVLDDPTLAKRLISKPA